MKNNPQLNNLMLKALKEAQKAYNKDEVPIGAIVVNSNGEIIGRGHNQVEKFKKQTAHAEIRAIEQACRKTGDWRLDGCWIFVTLEPCALCMNLVLKPFSQHCFWSSLSCFWLRT